MIDGITFLIRSLGGIELERERARLAAHRGGGYGEYEQAIAEECARRGVFEILSRDTEFAASSVDEFASQLRGMGLPVSECSTFANLHCAQWDVSFGPHTNLQLKRGVASISHYTGSGSCSWSHDLRTYIDVAVAVGEFLADAAPMPAYMARISLVTGLTDRDDLRLVEDTMRAENHGLLDGLSRHEFDRTARRIVREW